MDIKAEHFNRWMDNFINDPAEFQHQWDSIRKHLSEKDEGHEPSYGDNCIAYLERLTLG